MIEALLLGIALAMDSLTVSIVNGMKYSNYTKKYELLSSISFGIFQGLMPLMGYILLFPIVLKIQDVDHWIAFVVLSYLGIKMIFDSFKKDDVDRSINQFTITIMLIESVATSIDALGSFILLPTISLNPYLICLIIFLTTTFICLIGHKLGKTIGSLLKQKAPIVGGLILIFLGIKCLIEHIYLA